MLVDRFMEISSVPRGSRHNTKISNYLVDFAKKHNLKYIQDEAENVIIFKDATPGYENCPALIMQGHMDMVCESLSGQSVAHDFENDGLELRDDGRFMWAEGTTLGADDGVALAYMLELLDSPDDDPVHPPLEMVFTTDEEIGMIGAKAMDTSVLKGRYLINVDSEDEGIFIAGSAGGMTAKTILPIEREEKSGICAILSINGLKGGHSGADIDKNRTNADILMGRLLFDENIRSLIDLISIGGGSKDNVIPNSCVAEIIIDKCDYDSFCEVLSEKITVLKEELSASEPGLNIELILKLDDSMPESEDCSAMETSAPVLTEESFGRLLRYLNQVPNGIRTMSGEIVESSLNLGILKLEAEDSELVLVSSLRSSKKSYIFYMSSILSDMALQFGGVCECSGEYPGYDMKNSSPFRDMLCDVYESVSGQKPVVTSIHAGLEIGVFAEKIPGLDIISLGPDVHDIHTVNEKLDLDSFNRMWEFLKEAVSTFTAFPQ